MGGKGEECEHSASHPLNHCSIRQREEEETKIFGFIQCTAMISKASATLVCDFLRLSPPPPQPPSSPPPRIIDPVHTKRSQFYPHRASSYCRGPPKVTSISAALLSTSCPGWKAPLGIVAKKVCTHVYSPPPLQFILCIVGFCYSGTDWTTAQRMAPVIRLSAWVWIVGINPELGLNSPQLSASS